MQEFHKEFDKLTLNFNHPVNDSKAIEYKLEVEVKRSMTVGDLKQQLGSLLTLNPMEIILKRGS